MGAWREQFLTYFTTGRANNGGTEAIIGIIELHRRIARLPQPTNYRLRMILAAGHLTHPSDEPNYRHSRVSAIRCELGSRYRPAFL